MRRRISVRFLGIVITSLVFFLILPLALNHERPLAQKSMGTRYTEEQFIETVLPYAKELSDSYGVRTSIILGQACLDSGYGNYLLAVKYHNLYGIKASFGEPHIELSTKVYVNSKWTQVTEDFVVYKSYEEAMTSYMELLRGGTYWSADLYKNVVTANSYQKAAQALQDGGYSTDPDYASKLVKLIKKHSLDKYDQ